MIKLLIADDNKVRAEKLINRLKSIKPANCIEIDIADCANSARKLIKLKRYDVLILDVVLPKRKDSTPSSKEGLSLLAHINNNVEYLTPTKIIGITAFIEDMDGFQDEFYQYTSVIYEAQINSTHWIERISSTIDNLLKSALAEANKKNTISLITIHGIRTFGEWQSNLESIVKNNANNVYTCNITFGFFSLFSFLIPSLRNYITSILSKKIHAELDNHNDKKIVLVGHSFGTYIASKAIESYKGDSKIDLVILAGSVLKSEFDVNIILEKSNRLINECGSKDLVLAFCSMFVLGLGDAGRVGFISPQNESFTNRYYNGGHSCYLTNDAMEKNWLPYIISDKVIGRIDNRTPAWYSDISEFTIQVFSKLKIFIYILIIYELTMIINTA